MPKPIHELPTEAQIGGGDHARIERVVEVPDGPIHVDFTYGTLDADGNFVEREASTRQGVAIRDREAFNSEATDHPSPSAKADPVSHMRQDVLDFLDANGLWPNTG